MKYKYIIIEDLPKVAENLNYIVTSYDNYQFKGLAVNLEQAVELISKYKPELIFLDIELGVELGFDLFPLLKEKRLPIPFVIVTSRVTNYVFESFLIDAIYFIEKPFTASKIEIALKKFEQKYWQSNKLIELKNKQGKFFINCDEIFFIEGKGSYSCVYVVNNKEYKFSKDLKEILEMLPSNFKRVQKSYIINNDYKDFIKDQKIHLKVLPIKNPLKPISDIWRFGVSVSDKY